MATITEKVDGRKYTRDANGTVAASRTFICLNAANEHSARVAFEQHPDSSQFPGATDFGLVLDRIDIEGRGGGSHYIINATYSTFRGGRRATDPTSIPAQPFFGWERAKVEVEIPWCWGEKILPATNEDTGESVAIWRAGVRKITERRIRRTLRVEFQTSNTRDLDVIAAQEDNVHVIQGQRYHFIGADVSQDPKDQTRFVITYTWEWDQGTYMPFDGQTQFILFDESRVAAVDGVAYIPLTQGAEPDQDGGVLLRYPYYRLDLIANENVTLSPRCIEWSELFVDADGWRDLPGMPNL
jgi:hypothetical protein